MSMQKAITIRFKLHGQAADLARGLHDFLRDKEGISLELDEIVKRQFIGWMQRNVVYPDGGEGANGGQHTEAVETEAVTAGDQSESEAALPSDSLLEVPKES